MCAHASRVQAYDVLYGLRQNRTPSGRHAAGEGGIRWLPSTSPGVGFGESCLYTSKAVSHTLILS